MSIPATDAIRRAGDSDRPLLSRLSPEWFRSNLPCAAWLAGVNGRAEAAVMLAVGSEAGLQLELAGTSPETIDRWAADLVETASHDARRHGFGHLDALIHSLASRVHAERLENLGFSVHETFDQYEVRIDWLVERVLEVRAQIDRAITSRIEARIEQVEAAHLDAVASAWSAWIGGHVDRSIQNLRARFHAATPDSPSRRLQLVASEEGAVIGFAAGHIDAEGIFKIDAEAVHPRYRLDPFFSDLTLQFYRTAIELGASMARFEAGSRQPNTINFARRWKVAPIGSQKHLRLPLGD